MPVSLGLRIALLVCVLAAAGGGSAFAQGKLDQSGIEQGDGEQPTTILVPDPEPEVSPTVLVEVFYPETVAYLKTTFPDLYQQMAEEQPFGGPEMFSQMDIAAGSTRSLREIKDTLKGSIFVASEADHKALIASIATLVGSIQDGAGEIPCSDGMRMGSETLLWAPFGAEFAPLVDAASKQFLEIAAAHPEGATAGELAADSTQFDLLYTAMAEAGVPPAYVDALRNGNGSGGILCTAYIRGLTVLNAMEGEEGIALRRRIATELSNF